MDAKLRYNARTWSPVLCTDYCCFVLRVIQISNCCFGYKKSCIRLLLSLSLGIFRAIEFILPYIHSTCHRATDISNINSSGTTVMSEMHTNHERLYVGESLPHDPHEESFESNTAKENATSLNLPSWCTFHIPRFFSHSGSAYPARCCKNSPGQSTVLVEPKTVERLHSESQLSGTTQMEPELGGEHVLLQFEGPQREGREEMVFNILHTFPEVCELSTNFTSFQAEFDLRTDLVPVSHIANLMRKRTGYTAKRVANVYTEFDAVVKKGAKRSLVGPIPYGVKGVILKGKDIMTIQYRPEVVGARDLLSTSFETPLHLAPRVSPEESKRIFQTAYQTLLSILLTLPILIFSWGNLPEHGKDYGTTSFVLATIIQLFVAGQFYREAFRTVWVEKSINMGLLVVLSTTGAYLVSAISFIHQVYGRDLRIGAYFETSALLVTLIMVGRLVNGFASRRATKMISLKSLQAFTARIVQNNEGGHADQKEIDVRILQYGDVFIVSPQSLIVTDGVVICGTSEVDESMLTGEVDWIGKTPGSTVIAGTINRSDTLLVRLTRLPGSNNIDDVASMVEQVNQTKPDIQDIADRFAKYFVPAIAMISLGTLILWTIVGLRKMHQPVNVAFSSALPYAISVVVVSCPCAIGLAVPLVVLIASGIASKQGVIVKSSTALQIAHKATHVVFDKTGTLTDSRLAVSVQTYLLESPSLTASLILGLTKDSGHPVAVAVARHIRAMDFEPTTLTDVKNVVGKGIEGIFNGVTIRMGNSRWLGVEEHPPVQYLLSQGLTVSCVTKSDILIAIFGLSTSLRENAISTVRALQKRGVYVSIVSGDDSCAVERTAAALGIHPANIKAKCTPIEKRDYVKGLMPTDEYGNRVSKSTVVFCGDGVNDAGAIAQADVGVYMASSSDDGVAQRAAAVTLMNPSLSGILSLMEISRQAHWRIIFNFVWSGVYNLVAMLYASGAFVRTILPTEYAGLGEFVSVLPVIIMALSMHWMESWGFDWDTGALLGGGGWQRCCRQMRSLKTRI